MNVATTLIDRGTALAAVDRCMFVGFDGVPLVHCWTGREHADWTVEAVEHLIGRSDRCGWIEHPFTARECLAVEADGQVFVFDRVES